MEVRLTPELEEIIRNKIQTGRYSSANEVLSEALRLMEQRDELRQKITQGLHSLRQGKGIDSDTAFSELQSRHDLYKRKKLE